MARGGRPGGGELIQEAIEVAVILTGMRELRQPAAQERLSAQETALAHRCSGEQESSRADIAERRAAADALGVAPPAEAIARVRSAHRLLIEEVEPHEEAEQDELYPVLDRLLGGTDAAADDRSGHGEFKRQEREKRRHGHF